MSEMKNAFQEYAEDKPTLCSELTKPLIENSSTPIAKKALLDMADCVDTTGKLPHHCNIANNIIQEKG